jgi:hypothetical protein
MRLFLLSLLTGCPVSEVAGRSERARCVNDAQPQIFKLALLTETASSRVRGGTQAFALPTFQWHADSGIGIIFRNYIRVDIAYGSAGGRLSVALREQTY